LQSAGGVSHQLAASVAQSRLLRSLQRQARRTKLLSGPLGSPSRGPLAESCGIRAERGSSARLQEARGKAKGGLLESAPRRKTAVRRGLMSLPPRTGGANGRSGSSESFALSVSLDRALAFGGAGRGGVESRQSRGWRCVWDARDQDRGGAKCGDRRGDDGCNRRRDDVRPGALACLVAFLGVGARRDDDQRDRRLDSSRFA
jgi:hypothetical protein